MMRNRTAMAMVVALGLGAGVATGVAGIAGCASSNKEVKSEAVEEKAPANVGVAVSPEQFEEIDRFFRGKTGSLQFDCYNHEVEKTGKKYEGHVSLLVVVVPGGTPESVKIVDSNIGSPGIEECIVSSAKKWHWPEVTGKAPYNGSISFKPAW